jgi:hypothetical protein
LTPFAELFVVGLEVGLSGGDGMERVENRLLKKSLFF